MKFVFADEGEDTYEVRVIHTRRVGEEQIEDLMSEHGSDIDYSKPLVEQFVSFIAEDPSWAGEEIAGMSGESRTVIEVRGHDDTVRSTAEASKADQP